jgi:hypothetical protein
MIATALCAVSIAYRWFGADQRTWWWCEMPVPGKYLPHQVVNRHWFRNRHRHDILEFLCDVTVPHHMITWQARDQGQLMMVAKTGCSHILNKNCVADLLSVGLRVCPPNMKCIRPQTFAAHLYWHPNPSLYNKLLRCPRAYRPSYSVLTVASLHMTSLELRTYPFYPSTVCIAMADDYDIKGSSYTQESFLLCGTAIGI